MVAAVRAPQPRLIILFSKSWLLSICHSFILPSVLVSCLTVGTGTWGRKELLIAAAEELILFLRGLMGKEGITGDAGCLIYYTKSPADFLR